MLCLILNSFFKRLIGWGFLLFLLGCTLTPIKKSAQGLKPDPTDLDRVEFALRSMELVSKNWSLDSTAVNETCVFLFGEKRQWILNCKTPLVSGPEVVGEFRNRPIFFTANSLTVPGAVVPYQQIASSVVAQATVLTPYQQKIHQLFSPPFFLVQKLEDLVAHHPGFPKETTKTEELLSIYNHEFFHVLQFTHPAITSFMDRTLEKRCEFTPKDLETFYQSNKSFQMAVQKEFDLLRSFLEDDKAQSQEAARKVLKKWLTLYHERMKAYENSFPLKSNCLGLTKTESFWTFIEGTARYVESAFLLKPEFHSNSELLKNDSLFGNFSMIKNSNYSSIPIPNRSLGPRYYYALGSQLSFILDIANEKTWKKEAFHNPDWIYGAVKSAAQ